jgi:prepilin signal peptidase PulO-like enzyme (type II secretory pathway)
MNSNKKSKDSSGGYDILPIDMIKYMFSRTKLFILALIVSVIIFINFKDIDMHMMKKTVLIALPFIIIFTYFTISYMPQPRLAYMKNALYGNSSIYTGFDHVKGKGKWPFLGSANLDIGKKTYLFLGGGEKQKDSLLTFDTETNSFTEVIDDYNISSDKSTYSAVSFDMTLNGLDDLIVGRDDGIFIYEQVLSGKFKKHKISDNKDAVPLAISIADIDKNGKSDIYVSYFTLMKNYRGSIFNDPSHDRENVLLKNVSSDNKLKFVDVTDKMKAGGLHNTFTSAFVDLNNNGYPDIVLSHDSGEIEILKNNKGQFFESIMPFKWKGNWMGIGVGDLNGNGFQDIFLTNVGIDTKKDKISNGDIKPSQKATFNHVLLQNNGDYNFTDITQESGISGTGFGWGAIIDDLNLNGEQELLFAENFTIDPLNYLFPGTGYHYQNTNTVTKNSTNVNLDRIFKYNNPHFGQTPLLIDLTNNGVKDIVWVNVSGPTIAYINDTENNFISIKLPKNAKFSNSKIILDIGKRKISRELIHGGVGFGSGQSDLITFGLGPDSDKIKKIKNITIKTIHGDTYIAKNPKINSKLSLKSFKKI